VKKSILELPHCAADCGAPLECFRIVPKRAAGQHLVILLSTGGTGCVLCVLVWILCQSQLNDDITSEHAVGFVAARDSCLGWADCKGALVSFSLPVKSSVTSAF
jgi:hypothetical protein